MKKATLHLNPDIHKATKAGAIAVTLSQGANKVVTLLGQVVLAWFLVPEDMGLVALASSISIIGQLFSASGIKDVLIQKQDQFEELQGQAASVAVVVNACAALLVALIAPLMAKVYGEPKVMYLVWISVLSWPLSALNTPYSARMAIDLRFRTMAILYAVEGLVFTVSCISLAWLGLGPYSLVLPLLWRPLTTYVALRWLLPTVSFARPQWNLIKVLMGSGIFITLASLAQSLQYNGVNYAAGIRGDAQVVGLYYWGYSIASQSVFLLALNLRQVFFPSFRRVIDDASLLQKAAWKWLKMLFLVITPICVLQFVLAPVLVPWLFHDKWWPTIPAIQFISLAFVFAPLEVIGNSIHMALGHFKKLFVLRLCFAGFLFVAAWMGVQNNSVQELVTYTAPVIAASGFFMGLSAFVSMWKLGGKS